MVSVVMYSREISPPGGFEVHTPAPPRLCIHPPGDARRREVEAFIRRVYAERYGADVSGFAPTLVSLQDDDDGIVAAAGYRSAAQDRLFLEGYFDQPIESLLKPHTEQPLSRTDIVEIGPLASARAGEGRRLVQMISAHLVEQGFDWVVCTLTAELRHLFLRIGITPLASIARHAAELAAAPHHVLLVYSCRSAAEFALLSQLRRAEADSGAPRYALRRWHAFGLTRRWLAPQAAACGWRCA